MSAPVTLVGKEIVARMAALSWTQATLADVLGCSRAHVSDLCGGRRGPSARMAISLSEALGEDALFWLMLDAKDRLAREPQP